MARPGAKRYKPGSRQKVYRDGIMSERRVAWIRTMLGTSVVMFYPPGWTEAETEEEQEELKKIKVETGPTVRLIINRSNARPVQMNLTSLTADELNMTREFYNLLFDLAEPIVQERDRVAQDAYDNGDDGFARIYREVPQVVVRTGTIGPDYQSIRNRLENFSQRARSRLRDNGRLRGIGPELAPSEPEEGRTQDDDAPTDES